MRMEKISDRQVRCVVTNRDLQERKISVRELRYGSKATTELFREMITRASDQFGFNAEQLPIMIEAVPVSPEELLVILSAVEEAEELDPHYARFSVPEEQEEKQEQPLEKFFDPDEAAEKLHTCVLCMNTLDEVIDVSRRIGGLFPGKSRLYRREEGKGFYLVLIRPDGMPGQEFNVFLNSILEFGEPVRTGSLLYSYLKEHEEPVMEDPLQRLFAL